MLDSYPDYIRNSYKKKNTDYTIENGQEIWVGTSQREYPNDQEMWTCAKPVSHEGNTNQNPNEI